MAGPIWRATILAGLKGQTNQPFTVPSGVERIRVCSSNGLRVVGDGTDGTYLEYFKTGTIPSGTCEVQVAPADSDGDGVTDDVDQCSGTASGVTVDSNGCEVKDDTETETDDSDETSVDSDGDGVPDDSDLCANTPSSVTVDSTGCEVTSNSTTTTPSNRRSN